MHVYHKSCSPAHQWILLSHQLAAGSDRLELWRKLCLAASQPAEICFHPQELPQIPWHPSTQMNTPRQVQECCLLSPC